MTDLIFMDDGQGGAVVIGSTEIAVPVGTKFSFMEMVEHWSMVVHEEIDGQCGPPLGT